MKALDSIWEISVGAFAGELLLKKTGVSKGGGRAEDGHRHFLLEGVSPSCCLSLRCRSCIAGRRVGLGVISRATRHRQEDQTDRDNSRITGPVHKYTPTRKSVQAISPRGSIPVAALARIKGATSALPVPLRTLLMESGTPGDRRRGEPRLHALRGRATAGEKTRPAA